MKNQELGRKLCARESKDFIGFGWIIEGCYLRQKGIERLQYIRLMYKSQSLSCILAVNK